ncbi:MULTISPECIES: cell wall-active antibiotics response protein LiaF [Bacillus]|uniref:Cell wall-active antibiotics response protein LiaF n=1 Tax=Bacillus bingmayongensis TaxID=1150157 RepID=A0ABU5K2T8_9BACI|nr:MULTISPECIES: cell wall-active antibiotics response protein LiaF [Bacillus]MBO1578338.1 transporter [Bacillus sp. XF8]MBY0595532.1 transporter [Bacillus bingmayongensis]MDZ5610066.1 cell wall-active antibiotics response protein LiaF [Bacillus pseudomycoides]
MKKQFSKSQLVGMLLIIFGFGLFLDMVLGHFEPGALIFAFIMIMFGRHYRKKNRYVRGNVFLFVGGIVFLFFLFSSAAFVLVVFACLAFIGYQLIQGQQKPKTVQVEIKEKGYIDEEKQIYRTEPYLKNIMAGNIRMMDHIYELEDINVQYGVGDVEIDLTTAMIPEGETVIVIRGVIGNIRLYVPYDIELSLNHSVIVGRVLLPGHEETGFNRNVTFKTEQYKEAPRRIKIISSLVVGDTEVRKV